MKPGKKRDISQAKPYQAIGKKLLTSHLRRLNLTPQSAPVAQLDRVSASEAEGHKFESCRVRHFNPYDLHSYPTPFLAVPSGQWFD